MDDVIKTAQMLKALGDPNRLQIALMLSGCEKCACVLLEKFRITQPTLSHHMKILCQCGLVQCRREGKWCHYSLSDEAIGLLRDFTSSLKPAAQGAAPSCSCRECC